MKINIDQIIPKEAKNDYKGYIIAKYMFLILTIITIIRSCIHIIFPDGGAGVIAGIDTTVEGGANLISIFSIWGLSQLLIAAFFVIVYFRYNNLISFCYLIILIEYAGRMIIGSFKPIESAIIAPGAIGNYILVPLSIVFLILSLMTPNLKE